MRCVFFLYLLAFLFASTFAQQGLIEVIRVDDIVPFLTSLMGSGAANVEGVAEQLAEFIPIGNLQGSMGNPLSGLRGAFGTGATTGTTIVKGVAKQILPAGTLSTYQGLKEGPVPTIVPVDPPQDAARLFADLGVKASAAKNTIAAATSLPGQQQSMLL